MSVKSVSSTSLWRAFRQLSQAHLAADKYREARTSPSHSYPHGFSLSSKVRHLSLHYMVPAPFRAEHIGSLLRPDNLLQARNKHDGGLLNDKQLAEVEDAEIKEIIKFQQSIGIKSLTDGEFRRHMFYDSFFENLEGFTYVDSPSVKIFKDYVPDVAAFMVKGFKPAGTFLCTGPIKRVKPCYRPAFEFVKAQVSAAEVPGIKVTLAAPEWFHLRHGEYSYDKSVYDNDKEYFDAIAAAYNEELLDLYEAGWGNVQIDDPLLAYFCADSMLKGMKEQNVDSDAQLQAYLTLYNDCLKNIPDDMVVGLHLCRGNFKGGMHFSEGGYDAIAVQIFQDIKRVDVYYLEFDTPRAGSFEPLKHLPKHKKVVLGVISSKLSEVEDLDHLEKRVREAATYLGENGLERCAVSPQCGFASHSDGNAITRQDMENKLKLTVDLANRIWKS